MQSTLLNITIAVFGPEVLHCTGNVERTGRSISTNLAACSVGQNGVLRNCQRAARAKRNRAGVVGFAFVEGQGSSITAGSNRERTAGTDRQSISNHRALSQRQRTCRCTRIRCCRFNRDRCGNNVNILSTIGDGESVSRSPSHNRQSTEINCRIDRLLINCLAVNSHSNTGGVHLGSRCRNGAAGGREALVERQSTGGIKRTVNLIFGTTVNDNTVRILASSRCADQNSVSLNRTVNRNLSTRNVQLTTRKAFTRCVINAVEVNTGRRGNLNSPSVTGECNILVNGNSTGSRRQRQFGTVLHRTGVIGQSAGRRNRRIGIRGDVKGLSRLINNFIVGTGDIRGNRTQGHCTTARLKLSNTATAGICISSRCSRGCQRTRVKRDRPGSNSSALCCGNTQAIVSRQLNHSLIKGNFIRARELGSGLVISFNREGCIRTRHSTLGHVQFCRTCIARCIYNERAAGSLDRSSVLNGVLSRIPSKILLSFIRTGIN